MHRYSPDRPLEGTTPAYVASRYQQMDWLKEILQKADRVDTILGARDADGRTALSWAAGEGHEAVVKLLIDTGNADVNSKNNYERTPLSKAAANGHQAVVRLFLDIGREVTVTEEVVESAARNGRNGKDIMTLLLDQRGDEIIITEKVVKAAARNGDDGKEVMALLFDRRGEEVVITEEVVKAAAGNEYDGLEVMTLLLDQRRDDITITEDVVKAASTCGQNDVLDLLSAYNLIPIGEAWRRIAMFYNAAGTGDISCIEQLLHDGIEPDMENIRMVTPLWIAAANGREAVVNILAQRPDVRVNLMSESGRTPLFWPFSQGYEGVVIILMEAGADANIMDENGDTPVTVARRNGHERVVKILEGGIH